MSDLDENVENHEIKEEKEGNSEGIHVGNNGQTGSNLNGDIQNGNSLNEDAEDLHFLVPNQKDSKLVERTKFIVANGLNQEGKDVEFIVSEYELVKEELLKLQGEYKLSLDREKNLCQKLQLYHGTEDSKVADLSAVNDELRTQLNALLEEFNCQKDELKRIRSDSEKVCKENDHLEAQVSRLQLDHHEQVETLEKRIQELLESENEKEMLEEKVKELELKNADHNLVQVCNVEELKLNHEKECESLQKNLKELQLEYEKEKETFEKRISELQSEHVETKDSLTKDIQQLKEKNLIQEQELVACQEKLQAHDSAAKRALASLQKELVLRVDQVTRMYEEALKEKENLIAKLIQAEEEKKKMAKDIDLLNQKVTEYVKETDKLRQKVKVVSSEHTKLQSTHEDKFMELMSAQNEVEKLKEEVSSQVVKVKWAQNKLKAELEAHKETKGKLSQVTGKLKEAREEGEQIRADCQAMIKKYQESEEMKSVDLDQKLKQTKGELKRHEREIADQDELHKMKMKELELLKEKNRQLLGDMDGLKAKIIVLEEKVTEYALKVAGHEQNALIYKHDQQHVTRELEKLQEFKAKYEKERDHTIQMKTVEAQLRTQISELETEIASCNTKESELLAFTERITSQNARLQSEVSGQQAKLDVLMMEKSKRDAQHGELTKERRKLEKQLGKEKSSRERDTGTLQTQLSDKDKAIQELTVQLEEARDELQVSKRKNASLIKDLTRQLQQSRRQLEKFENNHLGSKESLSEDSKSSSTNSLDKVGSGAACASPTTTTPSVGISVTDAGPSTNDYHVPQTESVQIISGQQWKTQELDPEKTALVERICRLQKIHAKKNEKLEFMAEHVSSLVAELQKKTKIIQYYVNREEAGALAPPTSDMNKVKPSSSAGSSAHSWPFRQAQLSRHGGIMASVYSSKPVDQSMTLELSLEINRKLQAVLEDTIIKNMTLKENMETLGDEITRLDAELQKCRKNPR